MSQEAADLASVAKQISQQVARLHKLAAGGVDGALKGEYADKIHSSAATWPANWTRWWAATRRCPARAIGWIPDLEQAQKYVAPGPEPR